MKRELILNKDHLSYFLRQLRNQMELIGPMRTMEGDVLFRSVQEIHRIELDCPALLPSVKEFFFPQYEPLFLAEGNRLLERIDRRKRVIFGLRSCDVAALNILDRFFIDEMPDPYYRARRKNTLLISVVCNNPDPTCFCIGLNTGPYLSEGFDIQFTDLGDRYFVQTASKRGLKVVSSLGFLFKRASKADHDDQYEVILSSKARFQKRISLEQSRQLILSDRVKEDFWHSVTKRCFECGGCVYECPLCTCFTVVDREYEEEGVERARLWDTCLFKGFTRMAGGVLPNRQRVKRTKRWFYHKLIHYPEVLNTFGCVGCGRCTVTCPGRIDMATICTKLKTIALNGEVTEDETD
ncbi:MAG: hypothetical protein D6710_06090 [Nitrospirae bacterium]|nr:MAG: hypothetical protein D6710_06090 [Nitrospirota bacterium]